MAFATTNPVVGGGTSRYLGGAPDRADLVGNLDRNGSSGSQLTHRMAGLGGEMVSESAMKTPLVIATVAFVLSAGSVLAALNNACKSGHHAWCAPSSSLRHHIKAGA